MSACHDVTVKLRLAVRKRLHLGNIRLDDADDELSVNRVEHITAVFYVGVSVRVFLSYCD